MNEEPDLDLSACEVVRVVESVGPWIDAYEAIASIWGHDNAMALVHGIDLEIGDNNQ